MIFNAISGSSDWCHRIRVPGKISSLEVAVGKRKREMVVSAIGT